MAPDDAKEALSEVDVTLGLLLSHNMEFTQDFLKDRKLHFSGTKPRLRERLVEYLNQGKIDHSDLVALLNTIEGWGNQHIYLYKGDERLLNPWKDEESVKRHLDSVNPSFSALLNHPIPLVLPEETTLSSVSWDEERLRISWVEKRVTRERVPDRDMKEDNIIWEAYQVTTSRGLVTFDWNLISNDAMLMIRTTSGTKYNEVREAFANELEAVVSLSEFYRISVADAIPPLQRSSEVRRRYTTVRTPNSAQLQLTSSHRSRDTLDDPLFEGVLDAIGTDTAGLTGQFYWRMQENLSSEVNCRISSSKDREQYVIITGEYKEQDVRYVLSRIRHHCG